MWEPENGEQHYSEQLVRLQGVPSVAYYYKPETPATPRSRAQFGLDDRDHVYICPQALFKFHPEFDEILSRILRCDDKGRLVLIEGSHSNWTTLLTKRFSHSMPDLLDRVQFVPQQKRVDFVNLIAISDVMLDTIHFCGFNTTLEGFAAGTPIVTLPGEFMRSRHTMSFYNKMGIADCIASSPDEYVAIAVRLGTEPDLRSHISKMILDREHLLWEDIEVVREFERFFCRAVGIQQGNRPAV
jgi:predicted O-linked N-acetylglucosamine transferase (SPINDLY family)